MNKIWLFISSHGHGLMVAGVAIVILAAFILMLDKQGNSAWRPLVWPVAFGGLGIYIIGRVGLALKSKNPKKINAPEDPED